MGTKRTIVSTGHVYIGKGKADGASIVILPLRGKNDFVSNCFCFMLTTMSFYPSGKEKSFGLPVQRYPQPGQ